MSGVSCEGSEEEVVTDSSRGLVGACLLEKGATPARRTHTSRLPDPRAHTRSSHHPVGAQPPRARAPPSLPLLPVRWNVVFPQAVRQAYIESTDLAWSGDALAAPGHHVGCSMARAGCSTAARGGVSLSY